MRTIVTVCLGLALAGCASARPTAQERAGQAIADAEKWCDAGGHVRDTEIWTECVLGVVQLLLHGPNAPNPYADRAKCRHLGLQTGTEAYAACVMQSEHTRAVARAAEMQAEAARQATTPKRRQGLSFMCKDAILRGDSGGTFIFC